MSVARLRLAPVKSDRISLESVKSMPDSVAPVKLPIGKVLAAQVLAGQLHGRASLFSQTLQHEEGVLLGMLAEIGPFRLHHGLSPGLGSLAGEATEEVGHQRRHPGLAQGIDRGTLADLVFELLGGTIGHEPFHH